MFEITRAAVRSALAQIQEEARLEAELPHLESGPAYGSLEDAERKRADRWRRTVLIATAVAVLIVGLFVLRHEIPYTLTCGPLIEFLCNG